MPHFYFHILNGSGETRDEEGSELPNLESARLQAVTGIRSILSEEIGRGMLDLGGVVRITDQRDRIMLDVPFLTAVELRNVSSC